MLVRIFRLLANSMKKWCIFILINWTVYCKFVWELILYWVEVGWIGSQNCKLKRVSPQVKFQCPTNLSSKFHFWKQSPKGLAWLLEDLGSSKMLEPKRNQFRFSPPFPTFAHLYNHFPQIFYTDKLPSEVLES